MKIRFRYFLRGMEVSEKLAIFPGRCEARKEVGESKVRHEEAKMADEEFVHL